MSKTPLILALLSVLGAGGVLLATSQRQPLPVQANAQRTHAPDAPVHGLVYAQPFALEQPALHWWRKERMSYRSGWLLVLEVDPAFVKPTDLAEPVLYVGQQTAERVNHGFRCGRVIAIVPSDADAEGFPTLDLATAKIWFGMPALPEQIDAAAVEAAAAQAHDAAPFSAEEIAQASARTGGPIRFQTREELDEQAARLVGEYCPDER